MMDGRWFDDAARDLGRGVSRRRVLAGLAAVALGVPVVGRAGVQGQGGESCGAAVCGPGEFCCNSSCSVCAPLGGACTTQACAPCASEGQSCADGPGCCEDLACSNPDDPANGVCTASASPPACRTNTDCPGGTICCEDGLCCPGEVECVTAADCPPDPSGCNLVGCSDDGHCVTTLMACCAAEGESCGDGCCGGLVCLPDDGGGATCQGCSAEGGPCGDGRPCCPGGGLTCEQDEAGGAQGGGVCVVGGPACMPEGALCDPDHCCGGLRCRPHPQGYSVCVVRGDPNPPTSAPQEPAAPTPRAGRIRALPRTGGGAPNGRLGSTLLALMAGAAAAIAGGLRPARQPRS
jgi:hypothetical protein